MKKREKIKATKTKPSVSREAAPETDLPELVTVMTRVAERLEALERKVEALLGRSPARHPEAGGVEQVYPPRAEAPASVETPPQAERRERTLYQAVCADCQKSCEVPFQPTRDRPVYCKECYAARRNRHVPQAHASHRHESHGSRHHPAPHERTVFGIKPQDRFQKRGGKHKPHMKGRRHR